jgi:uncharacterized protein YndB with AHSA1/START domain
MLKWIASGCLVIIVVIGVVVYAGYRKMRSIAAAGPSVTVAIQAPPERVFASMSHSDSLPAWFAPGTTLRTVRKGALAAGDTIFVVTPRDTAPRLAWVIDTVVPGTVIALRWVGLPNRVVIARRRDSISVAGDSTMVTSTIASLLTDSLVAARSQAGGVTGGVLEMGSTMSMAGARMQAEAELRRLKNHIEARPLSRP